MTPSSKDDKHDRWTDASRFKINLRDAALVVVGAATMWGTQVATQYGMRSDIRDLATKLESSRSEQTIAVEQLQIQINEWRVETKLNREHDAERQRDIAEVKGMLTGLGLIKEPKK